MIQVKKVSKVFPAQGKGESVTALKDVSLEIERGDIFGIIGHSGAGKSTLLRMLNGLEKPTTGSVIIDGKEISKLKDKELRLARQKIGMIFQHFHLLWSRTVRENVAFPLEVAGVPKSEIQRKVDQLLERVGLQDRADAYPSQLSGGQKQRVGIARALANDPDVLLCDEATSALDPETTASILQLLQEINRETGITLVLITHEMSVVRSICNKIAVMEAGEIVEIGEVEEIFNHAKHPVTRKFLQQEINEEAKDLGKCLTVTISKQSDWNNLISIAQTYQVSIQIVGGEIQATTDKHTISFRLLGEPANVNKAIDEILSQANKMEVIERV
ncbi:methionine ABC transporter ATP-binding protein [Thermoflavimicrobium dichotomicum]|uniref:D-methionine transport system ATP-binding protein n=1 Tax=Thermoflavimicrobium dichotomicum TaxID=46223 RepID=A0A1I3JYM7_9BACL|nr:ATP-binding cassette domain-containing protein [Thermoflavimicrobium dichotomicum]SFI65379.1 D-methionine transport system ATP-binding protein [Thermoflavimicrobium dichotomicum]